MLLRKGTEYHRKRQSHIQISGFVAFFQKCTLIQKHDTNTKQKSRSSDRAFERETLLNFTAEFWYLSLDCKIKLDLHCGSQLWKAVVGTQSTLLFIFEFVYELWADTHALSVWFSGSSLDYRAWTMDFWRPVWITGLLFWPSHRVTKFCTAAFLIPGVGEVEEFVRLGSHFGSGQGNFRSSLNLIITIPK